MKTAIRNLVIAAALCIGAIQQAQAQGTYQFITDNGLSGASANTVKDKNGTALGTSFFGEIYFSSTINGTYVAGGQIDTFGAFTAGQVVDFTTLTAPFAAGPAFYQLRAWNNTFSTFEAAQTAFNAGNTSAQIGSSSGLSISGGTASVVATGTSITLGGGINPTPFTQGHSGFQLVSAVPEPATLALGVLGFGGLLLRRRKE